MAITARLRMNLLALVGLRTILMSFFLLASSSISRQEAKNMLIFFSIKKEEIFLSGLRKPAHPIVVGVDGEGDDHGQVERHEDGPEEET